MSDLDAALIGSQREKQAKRRIAVIDCETDPFKHGRLDITPFLWGFYDGETYRSFPDAARLMAFIGRGRYIIYAHNGGKFDFHFLFDHMTAYSEVLIINGRLAKFSIKENEFRDSYCLLPVPLSAYKKDDFDYRKMERDVRAKHMPEIEKYLKSDCVNLYELVTEFAKLYGTGKEGTEKVPAITLASTALKVWQRLSGLEVPISDKDYYCSLRKYYYGGRVECFASGVIEKTFHLFDINSAYPRAMMESHPFSTSFDIVHLRKPIGALRNAREKMGKPRGMIKGASLYRIVAISSGALPLRMPDGSLGFPDDDVAREYTVTGWELSVALETKTAQVVEWIERRDFHEHVDFTGYVDHFYNIKATAKERGDIAGYLIAKLMQNALYGKFCSCPEGYDNLAIIPPNLDDLAELDGTTIGRHRGPWRYAGNLGPWALASNRLKPPRAKVLENGSIEFTAMDQRYNEDDQAAKVKSDYYNVATGASITGYVRARIWEMVCAVRACGGTVLYCDTDSIACVLPKGAIPGKPGCPFACSKKLGDWTHEGVFDLAAIAGKKLYAFRSTDKEAHDAYKKAERYEWRRPPTMGHDAWVALEKLADKAWKTASKGVRLEPEQIVAIAGGATITYLPEAPSFSATRDPVFIARTVTGTVKASGKDKGRLAKVSARPARKPKKVLAG